MKPDFALPRVILVTRKTPLELLIDQHGTRAQARFYLESRGQSIADYEEAHERFAAALTRVVQAIPPEQRRQQVQRQDLDRFLFAPDDVVAAVGQDGLIPNVAKYLRGQVVIGVNPDPDRYDGVLCPHPPARVAELLAWAVTGKGPFAVQERAMAQARREDGQTLLSLNEIFIGHRSHQSARYLLRAGGQEERHSSSGLICSTGTGCTGWARSIVEQRAIADPMPQPTDPALVWFVREPFPSVWSGTKLNYGLVRGGERLELVSFMGEGGVIFADGIESDWIEFLDGHRVVVALAEHRLRLAVPLVRS